MNSPPDSPVVVSIDVPRAVGVLITGYRYLVSGVQGTCRSRGSDHLPAPFLNLRKTIPNVVLRDKVIVCPVVPVDLHNHLRGSRDLVIRGVPRVPRRHDEHEQTIRTPPGGDASAGKLGYRSGTVRVSGEADSRCVHQVSVLLNGELETGPHLLITGRVSDE